MYEHVVNLCVQQTRPQKQIQKKYSTRVGGISFRNIWFTIGYQDHFHMSGTNELELWEN
jgi:hypothetical protein